MPCHPHHLTQPSVALLGTASALLKQVVGQGSVMRREVAHWIVADNLLTGRRRVKSELIVLADTGVERNTELLVGLASISSLGVR